MLVFVYIFKGCINNKEDIVVEIIVNKKIMLIMLLLVFIIFSEVWGFMLIKICRRIYLIIIYNIWINVWFVFVFYSNFCLLFIDESFIGLFY